MRLNQAQIFSCGNKGFSIKLIKLICEGSELAIERRNHSEYKAAICDIAGINYSAYEVMKHRHWYKIKGASDKKLDNYCRECLQYGRAKVNHKALADEDRIAKYITEFANQKDKVTPYGVKPLFLLTTGV